MAEKTLKLKIGVDASELSKLDTFVNVWSPKIGAAMTGIGAAITGALGFAVKAFGDAEVSSRALGAALESTAGRVGITRQELDGMATALSRVSTADDDAISGAQALLLAYENVGQNVFPQAMQAALDLAAATGQDLPAAIAGVGKALNDPEHGLKALKFLTDEQRDLIKELAKAGDLMGAQTLIIEALGEAYGGRAKAEAAGFTGQITQLKNEAGNLVETIGGALVPSLSGLLEQIKPVVISVTDWAKENPGLMTTLVGITAGVGGLFVALGPVLIALPGIVSLIGGAGGLTAVIAAATGPIGLTVAAIAGLVTAGVALYTNSETVRDTVKGAWDAIKAKADIIFPLIEGVIRSVTAAIESIWNQHKDVLIPAIEGIWNLVKGVFDAAFTTLTGVLEGGLKILDGVVTLWTGIFTGDWETFAEGIGKIWGGVWTALSGMVEGVQKTIETVVTAVWSLVTGLFEAGKNLALDWWNKLWGALAGIVTAAWETAKTTVQTFKDGVVGFFLGAKDVALGWWNGLWNALSGVVTAAWNTLKGAVQGVTDGVTGFFQGMYDKVVGHSIVPDMIRDIGIEFGKLPNSMSTPVQTDITRTIGIFTDAFKGEGPILGKIGAAAKSIIGMLTGAGSSGGKGLLDGLTAIIFGSNGIGAVLQKIQAEIGKWTEKILLGAEGAGDTDSGGGGGGGGGKQSLVDLGIQLAVWGLTKLFSSLFGPDKDKLEDTAIVQQGWPEIWKLQDAFTKAPSGESGQAEEANRVSVLVAGITGWNEMAKAFKRPESKETQRPYIFEFIEAVNRTFQNRIAGFADFTPGPMTIPVTPLARGGIVLARPGGTVVRLGEAGEDEAVVPLSRGRRGRGLGVTIQQTNHFTVDDQSAHRRLLARVNRDLVRQLS